jgi:predicted nucleic-acid-binding Zn-ribbon protein
VSRRYFDCPKCGEVNPSVVHHRRLAVGCLVFFPFSFRASEHLHLTCGRCAHSWTRNILA